MSHIKIIDQDKTGNNKVPTDKGDVPKSEIQNILGKDAYKGEPDPISDKQFNDDLEKIADFLKQFGYTTVLAKDNKIIPNDVYYGQASDPLRDRYPSEEMRDLVSNQTKYSTWRKMWTALAESTYESGITNDKGELLVTKEQVEELKQFMDKINWETAIKYEGQTKHDVVAHLRAFGDQCPNARRIIHLGATSCDITDNADLVIYNKGLDLIKKRLVTTIYHWSKLAEQYKDLTIVGRTHYVPAQTTTLGKRIAMWLEPLVLCLRHLEFTQQEMLKAKGLKGAVGTQESFLKLCKGDKDKVKELNERFVEKTGFKDDYKVIGQTYPRIVDAMILESLANIAAELKKMATNERLMQGLGQVCEFFDELQKGSSAMPQKQNPKDNERLSSLARLLFAFVQTALSVAAEQWLERSLDDSAGRRLTMAPGFMIMDSCLILSIDIAKGLMIYEDAFESEFEDNKQFMIIEDALSLAASRQGAKREEIHEKLRQHSLRAIKDMHKGKPNQFADFVVNDPTIEISREEMDEMLENAAKSYGLAVEQVDELLESLEPIFEKYKDALNEKIERPNI